LSTLPKNASSFLAAVQIESKCIVGVSLTTTNENGKALPFGHPL